MKTTTKRPPKLDIVPDYTPTDDAQGASIAAPDGPTELPFVHPEPHQIAPSPGVSHIPGTEIVRGGPTQQ